MQLYKRRINLQGGNPTIAITLAAEPRSDVKNGGLSGFIPLSATLSCAAAVPRV